MKESAYRARISREKEIKEIIGNYKTFSIRLHSKKSLSKDEKEHYLLYKQKVDDCIAKLSNQYATVFTSVFINGIDSSFEFYYSPAHYYRLRRDSGLEFLKLYKS